MGGGGGVSIMLGSGGAESPGAGSEGGIRKYNLRTPDTGPLHRAHRMMRPMHWAQYMRPHIRANLTQFVQQTGHWAKPI